MPDNAVVGNGGVLLRSHEGDVDPDLVSIRDT